MLTHCGFNLHLHNDSRYWTSFHIIFGMSIQILCLFLNWLFYYWVLGFLKIYSGYNFLIWYIICKYFLPLYSCFFYFLAQIFMMHFEFIFAYGVRYGLKFFFFFFAFEYPLVPAPFVEKIILFPLDCPGTVSKISCPYMCGSISELSVLFHWIICLLSWFLSLYNKSWYVVE